MWRREDTEKIFVVGLYMHQVSCILNQGENVGSVHQQAQLVEHQPHHLPPEEAEEWLDSNGVELVGQGQT